MSRVADREGFDATCRINDLGRQTGVSGDIGAKALSGEVTNRSGAKRLLVCGGRNFNDHKWLRFVLDETLKTNPIEVVIHGAARGADGLAGRWAFERGVPTEAYPANWERDGKAAGPIRNLKMLAEGKPDLVIAFDGDKGTAHMKKVARAHGVRVVEARSP